MAATSGKTGLVSVNGTSALSTILNWKFNPAATLSEAVASNSEGMEFHVTGVTDFTGSFDFKGINPLSLVVPGTAYVVYLQTSDDEAVGGIIIDSITATCDIEGGGMVSGTANFSSIGSSTATYTANNNAVLYNAALTSLTNTSTPAARSGKVGKATWAPIVAGTLQTQFDIPNVRNWTLNLASQNTSFASSSTGGVTKRVAGVKRGATFSLGMYEGAIATFDATATKMLPGTTGKLRLYVNASEFWQIDYATIRSLPIDNNMEAGAMTSNTIDLAYTGYADENADGTLTRGTIIQPSTTVYW